MLVPSLLQHCGETHKSLVGVGTNEGNPPPPWVKSAPVHHQQPGLASHQLENQQTQRSNNLLTFCPLRIASVWTFLVMFYEDRSFSPLLLIFSSVVYALVWMGNQTMTTSQIVNKFKVRLLGLSSSSGHIDRSACEAKGQDVSPPPVDRTLLSHPNVVKLTPRLHLIMFVPSFTYICQHSQTDPLLFCVLFLCSTIIVTVKQ